MILHDRLFNYKFNMVVSTKFSLTLIFLNITKVETVYYLIKMNEFYSESFI